jgi:hypothetical protein
MQLIAGDIDVQLKVELCTPKGNLRSSLVDCDGFPEQTATGILVFRRHEETVLMVHSDRIFNIEEAPANAAAERPVPDAGR